MSKKEKKEAEAEKRALFPAPIFLVLLVGGAFLAGTFWAKIRKTESSTSESQEMASQEEAATPTVEEISPFFLPEEISQELAAGGVSKGDEDASVVIVEFSDFQCPACAGASVAVGQILEQFGDQIKFVFRQFPLSFHPMAQPSALASLCAHDQGKFWEYHDQIFANQAGLSEAALKTWAKQLGLKETQFNQCLDQKQHQDQIEKDYSLGLAVSVSGTPTFFINGKAVGWKNETEGWLNALKRSIEEELKQ